MNRGCVLIFASLEKSIILQVLYIEEKREGESELLQLIYLLMGQDSVIKPILEN
jgi:hypothetical protein